jgi:hypothetical protein
MRFADTSRGRPFSKDPAVVRFQNQYWLYYSKPPFGAFGSPQFNRSKSAGDGWAIGIATSRNLEEWDVTFTRNKSGR